MALPVQDQVKYWGAAAIVFAVVLYALGDVLLPFVLGGAIAYCLDPAADRLEEAGFSRGAATGIITTIAVLILVPFVVVVAGLLSSQAAQLIQAAPGYFGAVSDFLDTRFNMTGGEGTMNQALDQVLVSIGETIRERGSALIDLVFSSASGLANFFVVLVIAPVVAVYLLYDWDRLTAEVDSLVPRDHAPIVRQLASEIDRVLASFIRGMGAVCLILGTYYAVMLMLVGLQFGLVVGFIAGLVTFIPYLGALIGGALAIGLALFQFWGDWLSIGLVAAIFAAGQMVEGNILTPKLVGNSVGLHPVWLLLALSVFGALFGFVGMLVAVPLAAALGVLARFAAGKYREGQLYRGLEGREK